MFADSGETFFFFGHVKHAKWPPPPHLSRAHAHRVGLNQPQPTSRPAQSVLPSSMLVLQTGVVSPASPQPASLRTARASGGGRRGAPAAAPCAAAAASAVSASTTRPARRSGGGGASFRTPLTLDRRTVPLTRRAPAPPAVAAAFRNGGGSIDEHGKDADHVGHVVSGVAGGGVVGGGGGGGGGGLPDHLLEDLSALSHG